jgi:hypothetical protein
MVANGRNYTIALRTGEDGTQYVRIREALPHSRSARRWVLSPAESLTMLKTGLRKALRLASRRA